MPLILGTNSIKDTGFNVANSLRFNSGSSDSLSKAFNSHGTRTKWTWSIWFKRSKLSGSNVLGACYFNDSNEDRLEIDSNGQMIWYSYQSNAYVGRLKTNRKFRDVSAWYHLVLRWDTGDSTADNRMKIWINGVEETSFANRDNPSSGAESLFNYGDNSQQWVIGHTANVNHYGGYMAEVVFCDNQKLEPTSFGEYNEDSPTIWQPIDVSGLTFGTNGFYLDFEDSSALGNDAAGSNNFTVNNLTAIDQATDTCTNNFCTLNPLHKTDQITFSEGNCKWSNHASNDDTGGGIGTFGVTKGKWYFEVKLLAQSGNHTHGVISEFTNTNQQALQNKTGVTSWRNSDGGEVSVDGTVGNEDYGIMAQDSIMGIALDIDNYNISFYDDNTALASDINMSSTRGTIFPCITAGLGTTAEVNFGGCSAFAVSSAESDANGYGNFEHAPPSGYYALCTKNLAEFG